MLAIEECPICFETFSESHPPHAVKCGHIFCGSCLEACNQRRCGLCKAEFETHRMLFLPIELPSLSVAILGGQGSSFHPEAMSVPPLEEADEGLAVEFEVLRVLDEGDLDGFTRVQEAIFSWLERYRYHSELQAVTERLKGHVRTMRRLQAALQNEADQRALNANLQERLSDVEYRLAHATNRLGPPKPVHLAYCGYCQSQIVGVRYMCLKCPSFDLCETCLSEGKIAHGIQHTFLSIERPEGRATRSFFGGY